MLRSVKELIGYRIEARDGELGRVEDLLFDDQSWSIRYLVAATGPWLFGRRTLVPHEVFGRPDWTDNRFPVAITREQIRGAPGIATDAPVSRRHELEYLTYFGQMPYWRPEATGPMGVESDDEQHLRSIVEVSSYDVETEGRVVGTVDDMIADDQNWLIRHLAVVSRRWPPTREVLVASDRVSRVRWEDRRFELDLTAQQLDSIPAFDPNVSIQCNDVARLYDYFGRPYTW